MIGLKNIRKQRHLNQQKVAMDLNISREALSYYENGKREPSLALLVQMSKYYMESEILVTMHLDIIYPNLIKDINN